MTNKLKQLGNYFTGKYPFEFNEKVKRSSAFFVVTGLVVVIFAAAFILSENSFASKSPAPVTKPVVPRAAATNHLKKAGTFTSLSEAVTAARYQIDEVATGAKGSNSAHGFQINFDSDGLQLISTANGSNWSTKWSLSSFGYGEDQTAAEKGDLQTNGNRVEIRRQKQNLTEWFVNETSGLEHGFTIAQRPAGSSKDEALRLVMKVKGDLKARADDDGQMLTLSNNKDEKILQYERLKVWDSEGTELIARMRTDEKVGEVWYEVEDATAIYPLTIDPTFTFINEKKITASDGASNNFFGVSVAVSENTVIVGSSANSAYVFVKDGTNWIQQQKLTVFDSEPNDRFGASVDISGNTAIVGASGDDSSRGSAYVFVRNGTNWTQQQKLTASDAAISRSFGNSLSIDGDRVIVGASAENFNRGAAYIFDRSGTNWTQQQKLTASDGANGDLFGDSVSINGYTLIVGSSGDTISSNIGQGSAFIFVRNGTSWSEQQKLTASDGGRGYNYGNSVDLSGDTAIVGAFRTTVGSNGVQGAAYVSVRNGTNWTEEQKLTASDGSHSHQFANRVGINGNTIIVGSHGADANRGAAYIFSRNGTIWSEDQKIISSDGENDAFGITVAISSDTIIVGSPRDDIGSNTDQGSAYIYSLPAITVNITTDEADPTPTDGICDIDPATSGLQCSLRAAIETANANAGADKIEFNIPGGGVQTIAPLSELPFITGTVEFDATTQPGYVNSPMVEVQGMHLSENSFGLAFANGSDGSAVLGLAINRFASGIQFQSSDNRVEKCYLGIDANGSAVGTIEQQLGGVVIGNGSNNNTIGGASSGSGNVISNHSIGVSITGTAEENKILGNKIGTNVAGNSAIPNFVGIVIRATGNNIIGDELGVNGNLVSGNSFVGILLKDNASNSIIVGNLIGTKANGTETLPNGENGIYVDSGANSNLIGNDTIAGRNIIGGHNVSGLKAGIVFDADAGSNNRVAGNLIGVARDEQTALPNKYGIIVNADGQIISSQTGRNIIGFNEAAGIFVFGSTNSTDPPTQNNIISYNFIGTNGTSDLGNDQMGIFIAGNAQDNIVSRNYVSGNDSAGILVFNGANSNLIGSNFVGIDEGGNTAIRNPIGIWILGASDNSVVSNVVSGNSTGILIGEIFGALPPAAIETGFNGNSQVSNGTITFTSENQVLGNTIGLNIAKTAAVPNEVGIWVAENARTNFIGSTSGGYNLVSGNTSNAGTGILLGTSRANLAEEKFPQSNILQGNVIGLAGNLQTVISNTVGLGIIQAKSNLIGGDTDQLANTIVGSTQEGLIVSDNSRENTFLRNYLGVLPPGLGTLSKAERSYSNFATNYGNGGDGILISGGSSQNTLGGTNASSGLVIANNGGNGITLSSTAGNGNRIGTNSIFGNTGNSVDIGGDGHTPNDPTDADVGPNNLQNYPEIDSYEITNGNLIVNFKVDSAPTYSVYGTAGIRAEFFKADASGEGERFLGFAIYTAADYNNGSPNLIRANLGNAAALNFSRGDPLTATATDADGNSSEFAPAVVGPVVLVTISGRVVTPTGLGLRNAAVSLTDSSGVRRNATTSSFGLYSFENIPAGQNYVVGVASKRYRFAAKSLMISGTLTNVDFIGLE